MAKIVRITFLLRKRDDVTYGQFHKYWSEEHPKIWLSVPIVKQNLVKYSQFHADEKLDLSGTGMPPVAPFDGAATMWAKSLEDLHAIFSDPEYNRIVVPDEEKFLKRSEAVPIVGWDEVKFVKEDISRETE
ncbi:dimeric alpha+beta barrel [Fusarium pseudoanthophilum]|uniref:Dimeric alpha+beta barrel n=1 Tax=Fusarium pseudoanthophilum TaxID=48495 RepID=A0A8H5KGI5_9HYPO|nr:dimeric alpha+beta barrel [Fusarium pseudoanthophilum]